MGPHLELQGRLLVDDPLKRAQGHRRRVFVRIIPRVDENATSGDDAVDCLDEALFSDQAEPARLTDGDEDPTVIE
jgi:hypothetical protein